MKKKENDNISLKDIHIGDYVQGREDLRTYQIWALYSDGTVYLHCVDDDYISIKSHLDKVRIMPCSKRILSYYGFVRDGLGMKKTIGDNIVIIQFYGNIIKVSVNGKAKTMSKKKGINAISYYYYELTGNEIY